MALLTPSDVDAGAAEKHSLVIADTYLITVTIKDSLGQPFDLANVTGGTVDIEDENQVSLIAPTLSIVDATNGLLQWTATAAATGALTPQLAQISARLTFNTGEVITFFHGLVEIVRFPTSS